MDVPLQMRGLPVRGSLVVGFIFGVDAEGVPDFTVLDDKKVIRCVEDRLCGMCGGKLDYWMAFVGGPLSIQNRLFFDPAMHEACARYALSVCPFLLGQRDYTERLPREGLERGEFIPGLAPDAPEEFGMLICRDYKIGIIGYSLGIQAATPKRVDWFKNGIQITTKESS